ncbi:YceI family protein [Sphingobium yanoikuyae]|uniref:Polyisoprenoid-binding protein n=1 Tax=Sphingobium yanoikuyae TaxID=13690 RepID=A0A430BBD6_SPHYA|nr:YceI family protein [Sphingobium yanoikuyae]RSU45930.1 polyisoprenoid-binding protein [Sphingobium yanoikuyae]
MKKTMIAGSAVMLLGLAPVSYVLAQQVASTNPATVEAGTYQVEPYHTQIGFTLLHLGFSHFSGVFSQASGTLTIDPARPEAAKLEVSVPIQSVSTQVSKLDEELKGDQWFDAGQFPNATFSSTKVTPGGNGSATIAGNLTLHGVTRPVTLTAHFVGGGVNPLNKAYTIGFDATGTIKRSDFGVKTYVPLVGDEVTLTIAGAFEKQN